jgi:hypothetical protein
MAIQETRTLPAPFIEDIGKDFAKNLIGVTGLPALAADISGQLTKRTDPQTGELETDEAFANRQQAARERFQTFQQTQAAQAPFAPQVAGQDTLQTRAAELAASGIGSYEDFIKTAQERFDRAGELGEEARGILGAEKLLGPLTGAQLATRDAQGNVVTPNLVEGSFMSPFQQQVIDTTLAEFDRNRAIQEQAIKDQQAQLGVLGAGRAGVQLSEFGSEAARQRALLQAGLLQEGFNQAQAARQQDIANRQGLAQSALGIGQFQTGLGQFQSGLASQVPGLQRADIQTLGQVGAAQQAQEQAQLDASREAARMAAFEPQERVGFFGQGVTGLMGGYPARTTTTNIPNPTPLQTALGVGSTLAGIYGAVNPKPLFSK